MTNLAIRQFAKRPMTQPRGAREPVRGGRRGMVLLVVLVIIAVLALIATSFSYRMDAERMGVEALGDLQQARLAAESGMARVLLMLRDDRTNMDMWYDNPEAFRKVPVWMPDDKEDEGIGGSENLTRKEVVPGQPAWRYSVVAYKREGTDDKKVTIRYGITDESSKLNINVASRGELLRLIKGLVETDKTLVLGDLPVEGLVDTLIDWRDSDDTMNTPAGAESAWYMTLAPCYRAKDRPFQTIEELLMVKNWQGQYLYGEDYNRNGYLDENEDDGEEGASPPDNGDGKLNRGVFPFLTVYSWDWNLANDNKQRYNINSVAWGNLEKIPKELQEELSSDTISYLAQVKAKGFKFKSAGELWGLEVYSDGTSNYTSAWKSYAKLVKTENAIPKADETESTDGSDTSGDSDDKDGTKDSDTKDSGTKDSGTKDSDTEDSDTKDSDTKDSDAKDSDSKDSSSEDGSSDDKATEDDTGGSSTHTKKKNRTNKSVRDTGSGKTTDKRHSAETDSTDTDSDKSDDKDATSTDDGKASSDKDSTDGKDGKDGKDGTTTNPDDSDDTSDARKGTGLAANISPEEMNVVMNRLTAINKPQIAGQINVNTAPVEVLRTIIGLTEEDVQNIVSRRASLAGADKVTTAWLVTNGVISPEKYAVVSNKLTARSIQFTADVVGFADHVGTYRRLQAVIEMRGHMAQIRYYRDISGLGVGYPVRDDERSEGLAFKQQ
jgi:type II secretory pathway component PulK